MSNQLTHQQLELLVELNSQNELGMRTYSGRGMYGEYCLGFTGEESLLESLSNELFSDFSKVEEETLETHNIDRMDKRDIVTVTIKDVNEQSQKRLEFFQMFLNPRQDSMGLGTIVYFPNIKLTKEQIEFINNEVE